MRACGYGYVSLYAWVLVGVRAIDACAAPVLGRAVGGVCVLIDLLGFGLISRC